MVLVASNCCSRGAYAARWGESLCGTAGGAYGRVVVVRQLLRLPGDWRRTLTTACSCGSCSGAISRISSVFAYETLRDGGLPGRRGVTSPCLFKWHSDSVGDFISRSACIRPRCNESAPKQIKKGNSAKIGAVGEVIIGFESWADVCLKEVQFAVIWIKPEVEAGIVPKPEHIAQAWCYEH